MEHLIIKLVKTGFVANDNWRQVPGFTCYITNNFFAHKSVNLNLS